MTHIVAGIRRPVALDSFIGILHIAWNIIQPHLYHNSVEILCENYEASKPICAGRPIDGQIHSSYPHLRQRAKSHVQPLSPLGGLILSNDKDVEITPGLTANSNPLKASQPDRVDFLPLGELEVSDKTV